MINIAICDDDLKFLPIIKKEIEIELINNKLEFHIDMYNSSENLLQAINYINFDLVFLDIDMPNLTGIELVQNHLQNSNLCIVFVTNRDDLVFEALKCQPTNFIRKDFLKEELSSLIAAFSKKFFTRQQYFDFIINKIIKRVKLSDILYIENKNHYINVVCVKPEDSFTTKLSMKYLEKEINNPFFIRIHIGYLVNGWYIKQIGDNFVILDGQIKLPVSRQRMKETKKNFYMSRKYLL